MVRRFIKCSTCGAHGHSEAKCALRDLQQEQERRLRTTKSGRITADMLFPDQPELVRMLENVQRRWGILGVQI